MGGDGLPTGQLHPDPAGLLREGVHQGDAGPPLRERRRQVRLQLALRGVQRRDAGAELRVLQVQSRDGFRGPRQLCLKIDARSQGQTVCFRSKKYVSRRFREEMRARCWEFSRFMAEMVSVALASFACRPMRTFRSRKMVSGSLRRFQEEMRARCWEFSRFQGRDLRSSSIACRDNGGFQEDDGARIPNLPLLVAAFREEMRV